MLFNNERVNKDQSIYLFAFNVNMIEGNQIRKYPRKITPNSNRHMYSSAPKPISLEPKIILVKQNIYGIIDKNQLPFCNQTLCTSLCFTAYFNIIGN